MKPSNCGGEGPQKPVFVKMKITENNTKVIKPMLVGLEKEWPLSPLTNLQKREAKQRVDQEREDRNRKGCLEKRYCQQNPSKCSIYDTMYSLGVDCDKYYR